MVNRFFGFYNLSANITKILFFNLITCLMWLVSCVLKLIMYWDIALIHLFLFNCFSSYYNRSLVKSIQSSIKWFRSSTAITIPHVNIGPISPKHYLKNGFHGKWFTGRISIFPDRWRAFVPIVKRIMWINIILSHFFPIDLLGLKQISQEIKAIMLCLINLN